MLVELRQDVAQHSVKVELCVPQRAAVLHAATGTGKTYVACMLAMGKTTYCITHQNTPLQWQKEAAKVGLNATWVREAKLLPACVASLASDPKQMLIFSHGLLKNHRFKQVELPKAEFIIVDEVHTIDCNNSVTDFVWLQRDAFRLGMTATIQTDEQRENIANLMMLPHGGLDAATIKLPESANTAAYPEVDFQVRRVQLSSLERSAYDVSHRIDSRNAQVRAMLFPSAGGDDLNYCQRVWKNIAENFAHANRRIRDGLAKILARARRAPEHEETLKEHLGQEATEQIFEKVRAEEPPETFDSAPQTVKRIEEVWGKRKELLGAHSYVIQVLATLDAGEALECPVCYERTNDYLISPCGHIVCRECRTQLEKCPNCRQPCPANAWCTIETARDTVRASDADEAVKEEKQDTSGKLKELKRIINELGDADRALVVAPLKEMLGDVSHEMRKLGVRLIALDSGNAKKTKRAF